MPTLCIRASGSWEKERINPTCPWLNVQPTWGKILTLGYRTGLNFSPEASSQKAWEQGKSVISPRRSAGTLPGATSRQPRAARPGKSEGTAAPQTQHGAGFATRCMPAQQAPRAGYLCYLWDARQLAKSSQRDPFMQCLHFGSGKEKEMNRCSGGSGDTRCTGASLRASHGWLCGVLAAGGSARPWEMFCWTCWAGLASKGSFFLLISADLKIFIVRRRNETTVQPPWALSDYRKDSDRYDRYYPVSWRVPHSVSAANQSLVFIIRSQAVTTGQCLWLPTQPEPFHAGDTCVLLAHPQHLERKQSKSLPERKHLAKHCASFLHT